MAYQIGIVTCSRQRGDALAMYDSFADVLFNEPTYCDLYEAVAPSSIAEGYNAQMTEALLDGMNLLIFTHSDVRCMASPFAFDRLWHHAPPTYEECGFIGVAGARALNQSGVWWNNVPEYLLGGIAHNPTPEGADVPVMYQSLFGRGEYEKEALVMDGVFLCAHAEALKDFSWKGDGFHFYDIAACLDMRAKGRKNYVFNIPLLHSSIGKIDTKFEEARSIFLQNYGSALPQSL